MASLLRSDFWCLHKTMEISTTASASAWFKIWIEKMANRRNRWMSLIHTNVMCIYKYFSTFQLVKLDNYIIIISKYYTFYHSLWNLILRFLIVYEQVKQIIWMRRIHFMRPFEGELIIRAHVKKIDLIWWSRSWDIMLDLSLCVYCWRKWNLWESLLLNWNDKCRTIVARKYD